MQQDAIVIYHVEELPDTDAFSQSNGTRTEQAVSIEFSNSKSKELFDVDLHADLASNNVERFGNAYEKLTLRPSDFKALICEEYGFELILEDSTDAEVQISNVGNTGFSRSLYVFKKNSDT